MPNAISVEVIATKIFEIRGKRVMLDSELAKLYGVETKYLGRQVKRNISRFPEDFMFQLSRQEFDNLRCQNVTSNWGGRRYVPLVFTQEGVAMLSGVLNSKSAIQINIFIMRAFVKIRELLVANKDLAIKVDSLERKYANHDKKIQQIFEAIRQLLLPPKRKVRVIQGFRPVGK